MNYLLDKKTVFSNRGQGPKPVGKLLVTAVVLVIFLGGGVVIKFLVGPSLLVVGPLKGGVAAVSASLTDNFSWLATKAKLVEENQALRQELDQAAAAITLLSARSEEFQALERAVGRDETGRPRPELVAKVLAEAGYFGYDTFLLDKGRSNVDPSRVISLGDPVLAADGILLGEVVQIGENTSLARLYSSPGRKTRVMIGAANVPAVATGRGGGNFSVSLPAGVEIVHNDIVRTARNGREYVLGVVGGVESSEQTPFQQVYIKPPLNIYTLRFVSIYGQ